MVASNHTGFVDGYAILSTNQARQTATLKRALRVLHASSKRISRL